MKKSKILKITFVVLFFLALVLVGIYFLLQRQTYNAIETINYYENVSLDNPGYEKYLNGVLKYTRDGIAFLDKSGEEVWNHPCQMNNPIVEVRGEVAVICDRSGTSIFVFEEDGLKGEIKTTRPIERISVSKQGVVAAILKDDSTPKVVCYDATGNVLVEQNASLDNTGYPVDVALTEDGNVLLVSYLMADGTGVRTKIVYYDFDEEIYEVSDAEKLEELQTILTKLTYKEIDNPWLEGWYLFEIHTKEKIYDLSITGENINFDGKFYKMNESIAKEVVEEIKVENIVKEWTKPEIAELFKIKADPECTLVTCASIFDFAYDRVGVILYTDSKEGYIHVAFMDAEGNMQHCGVEAELLDSPEFTYLGNGEVTFKVCSKDGTSYTQKISFSVDEEKVNFVSEAIE